MQRDTVMYVTERGEAERRQRPFEQMERAKREEAKRRYRETTPGERLESALALGQLAAELADRPPDRQDLRELEQLRDEDD